MKLSEILDQLTHGEFRQLAIGGKKLGEISEENYPAVAAHLNLGLTALFSRFLLKEGRIVLRPTPGQLVYALESKYSVNAKRSTEPVRYLIDEPADIFNADTIIKLERVVDEQGCEQNLNDPGDMNCFSTPSLKTLRIPKDWSGDVTLFYRQNHPQLTPLQGSFDPARIEIELPYTHLEPLLYFVASREHNPMGLTNEFHMGNSYAMKYEQACQMLEAKNVQADTGIKNDRFQRGGWV